MIWWTLRWSSRQQQSSGCRKNLHRIESPVDPCKPHLPLSNVHGILDIIARREHTHRTSLLHHTTGQPHRPGTSYRFSPACLSIVRQGWRNQYQDIRYARSSAMFGYLLRWLEGSPGQVFMRCSWCPHSRLSYPGGEALSWHILHALHADFQAISR